MHAGIAVLLVAGLGAAEPEAARLSRGEVLVSTEAVQGSELPRAVVKAVIDAPPEEVWAILCDCASYQRTMPRIAASALLERKGDVDLCRVTADLPFPLPDLTSVTRVERIVEGGRYLRRWRLVEGDYRANEGSWTLKPWGGDPSKTLAEYRIHAEPNLALPKALLAAAQTSTLPDLIEGLRRQTRSRP